MEFPQIKEGYKFNSTSYIDGFDFIAGQNLYAPLIDIL